jgi:hypothetical protein
MISRRLSLSSHLLSSGFMLVLSVAFFSSFSLPVQAQALLASAPLPDAPSAFVAPAPPVAITPVTVMVTASTEQHKFWDRQNRVLLLAAAALNGADFAVTRANLQSGGQELNPVVRLFGRSTAGLAANFVGETVGVVSMSYFFHKTGHHKMERAVSLVNIGSSVGAVSFGLAHR